MKIGELKVTAKNAALRTTLAAADTGDINGISGLAAAMFDCSDASSVLMSTEFSNSGAVAGIVLALFDMEGQLMGVSDVQEVKQVSALQNGAAYVGNTIVVKTLGARFVAPLLTSISSGTATIYLNQYAEDISYRIQTTDMSKGLKSIKQR
jgi:hypothetical protein